MRRKTQNLTAFLLALVLVFGMIPGQDTASMLRHRKGPYCLTGCLKGRVIRTARKCNTSLPIRTMICLLAKTHS